MICPGCNRQLKSAPRNRSSISEKQEHLWGICPHCKESIHFVYAQELNQVYGSVIILPSRVLFHQLLQSFYQLVDDRVVAVFNVADNAGADMAGYQILVERIDRRADCR